MASSTCRARFGRLGFLMTEEICSKELALGQSAQDLRGLLRGPAAKLVHYLRHLW